MGSNSDRIDRIICTGLDDFNPAEEQLASDTQRKGVPGPMLHMMLGGFPLAKPMSKRTQV